jgi:hypothetical protein
LTVTYDWWARRDAPLPTQGNNNREIKHTAETKIDTGTDELLCVIRDRAHHHADPPRAAQCDVRHSHLALRTMIRTRGEKN